MSCRGNVCPPIRILVIDLRSRYGPFLTMVVENGSDPPPGTPAGRGARSMTGTIASWGTIGKNRVSSAIKQVDFTVHASLLASTFLKGMIDQLRLVDSTAALVPISGIEGEYGLLEDYGKIHVVNGNVEASVRQYLHGFRILPGKPATGTKKATPDRMIGTMQICCKVALETFIQNNGFDNFLHKKNDMLSKIGLVRCELPGTDRWQVGKFTNVISRQDLCVFFAKFLKSKFESVRFAHPKFAVFAPYTMRNSRSFSVVTSTRESAVMMQTVLMGLFDTELVSPSEINFIPQNVWRDQLFQDEKPEPMALQYNFHHSHRVCVISGVKNLDWITNKGNTLRDWLHSLTDSSGNILFLQIFEPVDGKMVMYYPDSVYMAAVQWRDTALLEIAQLLSEEEFLSDATMESIFTKPEWVREKLADFQMSVATTTRLAARYGLLGKVVLIKLQQPLQNKKQGKSAIFTIEKAQKVQRGKRGPKQGSQQSSNTSVQSNSVDDNTTLLTKRTVSSSRTTWTTTTLDQTSDGTTLGGHIRQSPVADQTKKNPVQSWQNNLTICGGGCITRLGGRLFSSASGVRH